MLEVSIAFLVIALMTVVGSRLSEPQSTQIAPVSHRQISEPRVEQRLEELSEKFFGQATCGCGRCNMDRRDIAQQ